MQHLFGLQAEYQVRGAVLADDMGLGKTFQLLALMAWLLERDPTWRRCSLWHQCRSWRVSGSKLVVDCRR
jgi:hypothetical protein